MKPADVVERIKADGATLQARTENGIIKLLNSLGGGATFEDASVAAGVQIKTPRYWRQVYPALDRECSRLIELNKKARQQVREQERQDELEKRGLVLPVKRSLPEPMGLVDFRWTYFGQPTPRHLRLPCAALEDLTNLYVFIFGPTGMGKDTLAGQYAAWRQVPDETGLKVTSIMKTGPKAWRRQQRIGRYLTDPSVYREMPEKTPDGQKPTRSLIDDYGPFKWEPGMMWEDGTPVSKLTWSQQDGYYFLYSGGGAEQDPNWQAVGIEGAIQGDRIDEAILSDIFDLENQKSPTGKQTQLNWVNGILHSRLDDAGRMVMIGNWMHIPHNYEEILSNYLTDANVLEVIEDGPAVYTKYDNGVAKVIIKAIWEDDEGNEQSYWPDRFPLDDHLESPSGDQRIVLDGTLPGDKQVDLGKQGWIRRRGLRGTRAKDPVIFRAMYQQERDPDVSFADFDDATLDTAEDHTRSYGTIRPHEILVLGVDPARRYGAAWVLWAVDRSEQTMTIADWFWGERLGYSGIKNRLILQPLARFQPAWLAYEDNREGAVLADTEVHKVIRDSGVGLYTHNTGMDRADREVGPGALAVGMRSGQILYPAATGADRARSLTLRSQFKAWDANPDRSKPGRPGHDPDDLTMAAWVGWLKARTFLDTRKIRGLGLDVPDAIRRRFNAQRARTRGTDPHSIINRAKESEGLQAWISGTRD